MRALAGLRVLGFASAAVADEPASLAPGSRVRVKASSPDATIRGTLAAISDESVTLIGLGTGLLFTASQTSQEAQAESDGLAAAIALVVVTPLLVSPRARARGGLQLSVRF